ncbi:fasciclin domain-containing protein [Flavivirga eckloniae]|uniref:Adhesin n=1 Tax=Flavivirga eckloniae TaxID=1803846 RepID=A0A2K9PSF2_9FLAO|nr:fasciclin domain-containing protein [Flavivirga eckloniae]AUP80002.1 adhesin [Flavivirga eckloniae]
MKTVNNILPSLLLIAVLIMQSCNNDDDNPPIVTNNIIEIAIKTPELTFFVDALKKADGNLIDILTSNGPFTVLAPNNAAFTAFLSSNNYASIDDVPSDVLSELLLNHVISEDLTSSDFSISGSGYKSTNASGVSDNKISIYFNTSGDIEFNNTSKVINGGADINASNGTIHIVDKVITLPSILNHLANNNNFNSLLVALDLADGDLTTLLGSDGPFTIMAPDNAAFTTFLDGTPIGDINTAHLAKVLLNHVLGNVTTSANLMTNGSGYTNTSATGPGMKALSLYYNTSANISFNGISTVTTADIVGTNGVIHAVNAVIGIPTVTTFVTADPNFATLEEALTTLTPGIDFAAILSRIEGSNADGIDPEFTVFAPDNDAFSDLSEIPEETVLIQTILHHIIDESNMTSGDLTPGGNTIVTTLEGDDITITLPGTDTNIGDITDGSGNGGIGITAVDIQAGNGVVHILDTVLIPDTKN